MQSVASFSTIKANLVHYLKISGLLKDGKELFFQFDTEASVTVIGVNTVCGNDGDRQSMFGDIIKDQIKKYGIEPLMSRPKTATGEEIDIFPCVAHSVSVMQTVPMDLYFYLSLGMINIPLLGNDFLEGCTYHHNPNGQIEITSMSSINQMDFYPNLIIDFDKALYKYYSMIPQK